MNRAQFARGRPSINRNASNLANPDPSQKDNVENAGANGNVNDRIKQLATAITQMATMLTQVNGMPIPLVVQQLGVEIPHLEAFHQSEHLVEDRQGRAPTVSHHVGNTRNTIHGPKRIRNEDERSCNVIVNSQNHL